MTPSKHRLLAISGSVLIALVLMFVLVVPVLAAALPNYETHAYYSVVKDKVYAPYTTADEFQRTSTIAYFSVVKDKVYAPYTTADEFQRTSTIAYYSVLH